MKKYFLYYHCSVLIFVYNGNTFFSKLCESYPKMLYNFVFSFNNIPTYIYLLWVALRSWMAILWQCLSFYISNLNLSCVSLYKIKIQRSAFSTLLSLLVSVPLETARHPPNSDYYREKKISHLNIVQTACMWNCEPIKSTLNVFFSVFSLLLVFYEFRALYLTLLIYFSHWWFMPVCMYMLVCTLNNTMTPL